MKRAITISQEVGEAGTIEDLTSVFENIASMRIGQVKDKVMSSTNFFNELWAMYTQLRVDPKDRLTERRQHADRDAFVVITSEGALSGDIDNRIIDKALENYDAKTTDLVLIGSHGANLLSQRRVKFTKQFPFPNIDQAIDVGPVVALLDDYRRSTVFYQTYVSLVVQEVASLDLISAIESLTEETSDSGETISSRDYLFEPSLDEVADFLESVMREIALSQVILQSRLAQYASRFNAMHAAQQRAGVLKSLLLREYHRAKRSEADERLKEIMNTLAV